MLTRETNWYKDYCMGRTNLYIKLVKPRFDEITQWIKAGNTYGDIAKALGISIQSWCDYLNKYPEFSETVSNARKNAINEVKQALFRKAIGFEYEEKKTYIKKDDEGKEYKYTEIVKKQSLPDTGAMGMYLRNYDKEWKDKDWQTNEFKRLELELKEKIADKDNW